MPSRNNAIDSLKLICALLVVFIHCDYPYRHEVLPITDAAVPLFFCISGYFIYGARRNWTRIARIAKIFFWVALIYLLKTEIFQMITLHHLWIPSGQAVVNLVFFNDVAFAIHLWYLPAYLYVLMIAYAIDKYGIWKWAFFSIVPLLLIGVYIKYCFPTQIQYFRNTYFNGLPYFLVGGFVKYLTTSGCSLPVWLSKSNVFNRMASVIAIAFLFIARYKIVGNSFIKLTIREIDLLLLTYFIFMFVVTTGRTKENLVSRLGRYHSLYIYISHVLVLEVIGLMATHLPIAISNLFYLINPFCVFILCVGLSSLFAKMKIIRL